MKSASSRSNYLIKKVAYITTSLLTGCSNLPNPARSLHEGLMISHAQTGKIPPTIIFQSGLGDGMSVWTQIIKRLPPDVSLFAYDRPGYGKSDVASAHRDPCTIARELHGVLQDSGLHPPYVLVGHSLGGLYQYAFAKIYPNEVGALLLIDATHPDHWATIQARAENTAAVLRGLRAIAFTDTAKREFDAQAECLTDLKSVPLPHFPAKLLTRGRAEVGESAEFQALSRELAAQWPLLVPGMQTAQVEGAGHYIQKNKSERVTNEILDLVHQVQTRTP